MKNSTLRKIILASGGLLVAGAGTYSVTRLVSSETQLTKATEEAAALRGVVADLSQFVSRDELFHAVKSVEPPIAVSTTADTVAFLGISVAIPELSLVGTWTGEDATGTLLTLRFGDDGSFSLLGPSDSSLHNVPSGVTVSYHSIPELKPAQLHLRVRRKGRSTEAVPFGVYGFDGPNKLILCLATTYYRTLGSIPLGISRYELPKDLSENCVVLDRKLE